MSLSARSLVALYDFVSGQGSLEETLARIVTVTAETLAADGGGVTLVNEHGRAATVGSTDPHIPEIDEAQYVRGAGPCIDASRTGNVIVTEDLRRDDRWPEFNEAAIAHGVLSTLSLPFATRDTTSGALNLYAARTAAFDDAAVSFGRAFANQAAIGISYWQTAVVAEHLQSAIDTRAEIEQAKGILMATTGGTPDQAFELLRMQSQSENRKLREIAAELVARQQRTDR